MKSMTKLYVQKQQKYTNSENYENTSMKRNCIN